MQNPGTILDKTSSDRDLLLLGRVAQGDGQALGELFDERAPAILGVLVHLLDRREAEEVVQEVFASVWADAASFQPDGTSAFGRMLLLARTRAVERRLNRGVETPQTAATDLPGGTASGRLHTPVTTSAGSTP